MPSKKIGMLFIFLGSALLPQLSNGLYGEGGDGMSVIVKGMEMPKNCRTCPMLYDGHNYRWCNITGESLGIEESDNGRNEYCPLIELPPHGRLIDIKSVEDGKFVTVGNDYQRWWNGALESVIDNAPTIIEGSET